MKVIIIVVSADVEPFIHLTNVIKKTWASYTLPEIDIYFYYGKKLTDNSSDNRDIFFDNIIDSKENMGLKVLEMFEYIKDVDYDYIFKTNSSSYVVQEKILEFLKDKPKDNFYCGIKGDHHGVPFVSGCGLFLSKDIVNKILDNKNIWNHNENEDVALSMVLNSFNTPVYPGATRANVESTDLTGWNVNNYYHFRCKQPENRDNDAVIFEKLYKLLNG